MPGRCWGSRWPAPSTSTSVPRGSASASSAAFRGDANRSRVPVTTVAGTSIDPSAGDSAGSSSTSARCSVKKLRQTGRRAPLGGGGQHVLVAEARQRGGGEPAHRPQREAAAHQPEAGSQQRRPEQRVGEHAVDQTQPPARSDR